MASRPQNIGIKAIELYFPNQCVEQSELEKFDGVSEGKYTIGLGQNQMSFCDDREDIYSLALTAVSSLLRKYSVDPASVGRLEVGTETLLDKSKSVKTVLMQLFSPSGNTNMEGVDTINACYGGTNALFNTVNWLESSAWDGRDAIVVAGDIALYKKGAARPTGGVGCAAMLVGPNAPLVFEPGLRGTHIDHAYDFYKADFTSEYPIVDGQYSLKCYAQALDACYKHYNEREQKMKNGSFGSQQTNGVVSGHAETNGNKLLDGIETPLDRFDHVLFHSPTCKTVQKNYARLLYNDYLQNPGNPLFKDVPAEMASMAYEASLTDKNVEKTFQALSKKRYETKVQPSIDIPTNCGNMYCASLYSGLCSLLSNVSSVDLQGRRIAMYSYGSGLASSFFSLKIKGSTEQIAKTLDIKQRLAARKIVPPQVYDEMCELREKAHLKKSFTPAGSTENMLPGTYYLTGTDDMFRRSYAIKQ